MSNNDYIIEAVKGEPGSLTSIAFDTGVIVERERIIKLLVPIRQRKQGKGFEEEIVADTLGEVIALIKGDNK